MLEKCWKGQDEQARGGNISAAMKTMEENPYTYLLVTPARNEGRFIEKTIQSVVGQTVRPLKWVIVSDGSTDGTDDIVAGYQAKHEWIELLRLPERTERHFAGKVNAFNQGYERVKTLKHDLVGSLDADITFQADYFDFLLGKFAADPLLGVGGTPFREGDTSYDYRFTNVEHVSGACQLFRRECFEAIGGYVPVKEGGIDLIAVVTARMKGWHTRTFTEKTCEHHRKMGTGNQSILKFAFKGGYHDYLMGVHPVWQCFRSVYQASRKPYIIWGVLIWAGYFWAFLNRAARPVTKEFINYRKKEQMRRLRGFWGKLCRGNSQEQDCSSPTVLPKHADYKR